jgi:hypothetical protein
MDNRLFDLIPRSQPLPRDATPIGWETLGVGGPRGDAITMIEFARDGATGMPRVFGVNHHPEIVRREAQIAILDQKLERGEVTAGWVDERREILTRSYPQEDSDDLLQLTSDFTLLGPLRFHLRRQVRQRLEKLGLDADLLREERAIEGTTFGAGNPRLPVLRDTGLAS